MQQYLLLSALLLWVPGLGSVYVEQLPFLMGTKDNPKTLECILKQTSCSWMYWYRHRQGRELEGLFNSIGDGAGTNFTAEPMTAVRSSTKWSLIWRSLSLSDSAVYYCACSTAGYQAYFGEGTRLTVLEDGLNITSPKVVIFPPSKQEIKEKGKATLVCLASDFYPDHIKLFWKVNDAEREDGVRTDDFSRWDKVSKSYSLTSRLRISVQEWFNSKNSFQCAVKFHLDKIQYQVIRGEAGCSITEESYMRYGNSTKLTYLVLLWKAMLYALLVSALVWRVKAGDKLSRE